MKMPDLFRKLRERNAGKPRPGRDWSAGWAPRDWADLPTYHPRREDDAV
jgi:hypothetical protein